jgi:hypothetical protein
LAATESLSCGRVAVLPGQPPLDEEATLLEEDTLDATDEDFDEELDEGLTDEEALLGAIDDATEEEATDDLLLAEEELVPDGTEHSFTPPPTRPPNVASLHAKLPLSTL